MELLEKTISSEILYEGRIVKLRLDRVELPNGHEAVREVVGHPGGAAVLPLLPDGRVAMVRQYRHPYREALLEIPAGKLDKVGEDPAEAALRELREETGYRCGRLIELGKIYPSPGYLDEVLHLYLAQELSEGEAELDPDEFLNLELVPLGTLEEMVLRDELRDAKTVAALYRTRLYLEAERGLENGK